MRQKLNLQSKISTKTCETSAYTIGNKFVTVGKRSYAAKTLLMQLKQIRRKSIFHTNIAKPCISLNKCKNVVSR